MVKNYLKTAFRNLKRQPGYSLINIVGLSIGMACFILLALVVVMVTVGVVAPTAAQDGSVLVMARAVDSTGLDPHTQTAFASLRLLELIYEPLVRTDENLNLVPALWFTSAQSQVMAPPKGSGKPTTRHPSWSHSQ